MPSALSTFGSAAKEFGATVAGESVTFARTGVSVEVTAVRGSTNWNTDAPFPGFRVGEHSTDWIVESAKLVDSSGNVLEPARGDTFTTSTGEVFRVMPMASDAPLWTWSDRSGQTFRRIYTKERS